MVEGQPCLRRLDQRSLNGEVFDQAVVWAAHGLKDQKTVDVL